MGHFVALWKIPYREDTAEAVLFPVFQLHGLPQDKMSNLDPQFASQFWKVFCRQLGPSANLSSPRVQWPDRDVESRDASDHRTLPAGPNASCVWNCSQLASHAVYQLLIFPVSLRVPCVGGSGCSLSLRPGSVCLLTWRKARATVHHTNHEYYARWDRRSHSPCKMCLWLSLAGSQDRRSISIIWSWRSSASLPCTSSFH